MEVSCPTLKTSKLAIYSQWQNRVKNQLRVSTAGPTIKCAAILGALENAAYDRVASQWAALTSQTDPDALFELLDGLFIQKYQFLENWENLFDTLP